MKFKERIYYKFHSLTELMIISFSLSKRFTKELARSTLLSIPELVYQARPSLTLYLQKVREGLANVISTLEMLTNQILLFHFE